MIVVGGQSQEEGCITLDTVFTLHLPTHTWRHLTPLPVPLCRIGLAILPLPPSPSHPSASAASDTASPSSEGWQVFVYGGWDGNETQSLLWSLSLPRNAQHVRGGIETRAEAEAATPTPSQAMAASGSDGRGRCGAAEEDGGRQQVSWNVSRPLELKALRAEPDMAAKLADIEDLAAGPAAVIRLLHTTAVRRGYGQYIDPATGFSVFTSLYLVRTSLCTMRCLPCLILSRRQPQIHKGHYVCLYVYLENARLCLPSRLCLRCQRRSDGAERLPEKKGLLRQRLPPLPLGAPKRTRQENNILQRGQR